MRARRERSSEQASSSPLPTVTVIHVPTADRPPQPMSSYLLAILFLLDGRLGESGFLRDELSVMNDQLLKLGSIASRLAWTESRRQPNGGKKLRLVEVHTEWRNSWCGKLLENYNIDVFGSDDEYRQFYLLCRGPRFEPEQARCVFSISREHSPRISRYSL